MNNDNALPLSPKILVTIIDRDNSDKLEDILREKLVRFHYMFNGMGTASSDILKAFGLSGTEKTICVCVEPAARSSALMTSFVERLALTRPGNGIAFTLPVSGASKAISNFFASELENHKERLFEIMDNESEKLTEAPLHELVVAVVNQGFSDMVMDAAHSVGARGGTIINARRSGVEDATKFFGITLQSEKEIVAIIVREDQKRDLMRLLAKNCGMKTDARGIILSIPVESCAGINTAAQ